MPRRPPPEPLLRLLLCLLVLALAVAPAIPVGAQVRQGATLTVLRGAVSVLRGDGTPVAPAASGITVGPGDQVATAGRASALVTFFDGSEVELGSDTTIIVHELSSQGGQNTITLESAFGSTVHRVVTLTDAGSSYRVEAGGSVALVRGTVFGHHYDPSTGDVTVA